ncbi:hypothetical protein DZA65_03213 [Dickeya dianthicola]|uniref:hypothetical protein n=1 Tax=Dickeya dianthicola TaxID=204039 RepID=UPI000CD456D4|nr:hypothetical protein [Dickeya dianthicola]AYC20088.1 hypothetical protein DZA65_03213 [Dickeya dianthicola]MBI0438405.1 hypothetical protein [Dickeya dianthicola]MBI0450918.1 hypothetical protein [Dickeya dianthicola]MBI0454322.1 hypothetical protein [Dickeya dianthicola]MBI0458539.1 hypothetical protein [Dickeya dianthicola]
MNAIVQPQPDRFDFKAHWLGLDESGRNQFASDSGTTSHYIQTHLTGRRKIPSRKLMNRIFLACKSRGWLTRREPLILFFYS